MDTLEEAEKIRLWKFEEPKECLSYLKNLWKNSDTLWEEPSEGIYFVNTGGWKDNEILLGGLKQNFLLWGLVWKVSTYEGKNLFVLPETRFELDIVVGSRDHDT